MKYSTIKDRTQPGLLRRIHPDGTVECWEHTHWRLSMFKASELEDSKWHEFISAEEAKRRFPDAEVV